MQHELKKLFKLTLLVLVVCLFLTACEFNLGGTGNGNQTDNTNKSEVTQEMLDELAFEDATFVYDGEKHGIYVDNIYEDKGVQVIYNNHEQIEPGVYDVSAAIKCAGLRTIFKEATLTIEKKDQELVIEKNHSLNILNDELKLDYTANSEESTLVIMNESGKVIQLSDLVKAGDYKLEVYLQESKYFKESNHETITVTIITSNLDITFASKEVIADGNVHKLEIEGTLPANYTVEYENNEGSQDGNYYAVANIIDETGTVIESHRAVLIIDNPENQEFAEFLDEFFVVYLEGDQLSVNIFCENPENFGLEHYDATWYTYESLTDEDFLSDKQMFEDLLVELEKFENEPLNDLQDSIYETVRKFLQHYVDYYSIEDAFFMEICYIDQFGGYVADFGTYMEAYSLRTKVEVEDVISYIESTLTAFPSYLDFLKDKTEKGYALSNYTLEEMRAYLGDLLAEGENYYLKGILFEKINELTFLTADEKTEYKNQIAAAIKDCFVVGVQMLYDGLEEYLDVLAEEDEGYLSKYENGRELYILELENNLGISDLDVDAYIAEIDKALISSVRGIVSAQQNIINEFNVTSYAQLEQILNSTSIMTGTPEEMLVYLQEFANSMVPELKSNPDIVVKNMDEASAKVSNAVAYYMKSALDNTGSEYITLNPVQLKTAGANDVLGTLAHEGYPGHLYAYVYSKELGLSNLATIMTSVSHAEGWATYVQLKLYEYAKEKSADTKLDMVLDYLYANQISGYLLETRLDAGIHLEGWGPAEIGNYMSKVGYSADSAEYIYDLLVEIPTQYVSYGYGKLVFVNLHNEAKEILGAYYDEVEFNAMLLSKGWTDLAILQETYNNYMKVKCYELGIDFE